MVGGFGDSEYLRKTFQSEFGLSGNISITVPDNALVHLVHRMGDRQTYQKHRQAAIVQGAAVRGLEGVRAKTRRCRRHYGISLGDPFREGVDNEISAYFDEWSGRKYSSGHMKWLAHKVGIL